MVRAKAGEVTTLPPHLPLLDRAKSSASRVRQPFYNGLFQETNPTGAVRQITATDAPGASFPVIQGNTGSTFQRIDLTETFRMFLVCVDERQRGPGETLRQLEWTVLFKGTFGMKSRAFTPDPMAGIVAQPAGPVRDRPVVKPPLSNAVSTFKTVW